MKITGFKTFIVAADSNWVFVQVHTDEGLTGLGEGSVSSKALAVEAAIRDLERFVIGRDPRDIEGLWQEMYRYPRWKGGAVLNSAISAVEIALWDILGQSLQAPIYRLLGGKCRDRIRMYSHAGGETPEEAVLREVSEELGIDQTLLKVTKSIPETFQYTTPPRAQLRQGYKGQKQQLFVLKFSGSDGDIRVEKSTEVEKFKWVEENELKDIIHPARHGSLEIILKYL